MKKYIVLFLLVLASTTLLCSCGKQKIKLKEIKSNDIIISYNNDVKKQVENKDDVDNLISIYNKLDLDGTTKQDIDYENVITVSFNKDDKVVETITIDKSGTIHTLSNEDNLTSTNGKKIYNEFLNVFNKLK